MLFDAVQWSYLLQFSLVFGVWCMHGVLGLVHGVWFVLQLSMVHLRPGALVFGVWCLHGVMSLVFGSCCSQGWCILDLVHWCLVHVAVKHGASIGLAPT